MRLVAGVTGHTGGMVGGSDLWKRLRLGEVGLVTADTQHGRVEFGRLHRTGVIDVFRQRPVARFAVNVHMLAAALFFQDL